ncbi:phosphatase PAP2 family protein [Candidatus Woesearchaeota archaeon]|nr:phosphatase PAP2 family protein [Candidatus Woesearchaeota archaeon]
MAMMSNVLLTLFFVLMLLSFFFDRDVLNLASGIENGNLGFIATALSSMILFFITLLACSYALRDKKKILYLFSGVGLSYIISFILKFLVQKVRPIESGLSSFGFPSSHATVYFFIFAFIADQSEKYKYLLFALAALVALSRVYLGLHYLSDVIGGGLLGVGLYLLLRRWASI